MSRSPAGADRWTPLLASAAMVLTLWSMSPVVEGRRWWGVSLLMILIVLVVGAGARWARLPLVAIAPTQVLAGVLGLTAMFAGGEAALGLLPGPDAANTLLRVVASGGDTIQRYQAPVPLSEGVTLLIAAGVLVIAVLVDLLAVTLRSPAAAGLPLLMLLVVPAAVVPDGLPWQHFAAAATGWLLLLAHDSTARVRRWGQLLPHRGGSASNASDAGALAPTGHRLAIAAIAAAIALPALAPTAFVGLLAPGGALGGDDRADVTVVDPVLTLRDSLNPRRDVEVLRYRTAQDDPAPLRILTADNFDGDTWKPAATEVSRGQRASRGLPSPPGLAPGVDRQPYTMRIEVGDTLAQDFLPLPYPTRRVDIDGAWLYDPASLNVFGDGETVRNKSYDVEYLDVRPTAAQLRESAEPPDAIRATFTRLPRSLPDVVRSTALEVTKDAGSPYDKALALQQWFRAGGDFAYSTQVPADAGDDAVAAFLSNKRGFCVQFSSSMAVMARALGIPARVAVGFLPGDKVADDDTYSVNLTDAHAWPELYFEGAGWVRFEPTPSTRAGVPPVWARPNLGAPSAPEPADARATPSPTTSATAPVGRPLDGPAGAADDPAPSPADAAPVTPAADVPWRAVLVILLLVAVVGLAPATAFAARWRRRRAAHDTHSRIEAAWADLHEGADDLGVPLPAGGTPRQLDAHLALAGRLASPERAALARVAQVVERSRYSRPGVDSAGVDATGAGAAGVDADVRAVLRALAATRTRGQRVAARALPRSGIARLARISDRAGQRMGGLDQRLTQRLRRLTRRRTVARRSR